MQRRQEGQIVKISGRWYVRYWEKRNVNGTVERKRVSHPLGSVTTRGKHPPADIVNEAKKHMSTINGSTMPAEHITTVGDFVENVFLPWVERYKRRSTLKSYRGLWEDHLKALSADTWLKNVRTFHVQQWLDSLAPKGLSRNSLKRIKSLISGMFKLAKQQDYFQGGNPAHDTAVNPEAAEPEETYAYSLEEINAILAHIPEPAATAFAVAAYTGLRIGEIEGLDWQDHQNGEIHVVRSIVNGHETDPKTAKSRAAVPMIRQLADRLEMHRLRSLYHSGPIFATSKGTRQSMNNLRRTILPALKKAGIEWHGWHACRRGLGSNLYRLGVADMVIQRILRHANVATTTTYYIKTVADDVRNAMTKLEQSIPVESQDTFRTSLADSPKPN